MKAWAGYVLRGKLPFRLTGGERAFLAVLQGTDILLVLYATRGL